jgi:deoxyribodipyrimidine photo-lyase
MVKLGIHIFRRDFRLYDNNALYLLSQSVDKIIPIFIFDPYQIDITDENKYYRSQNAINLMLECLLELDNSLHKIKSKLFCFYGQPVKIITRLIKLIRPSYISYNADHSKYSIIRDDGIDNICVKYNVNIIKYLNDLSLNTMELYLNPNNNSFFKVFGAYYKHAITISIRREVSEPDNFINKTHKIENLNNSDIKKIIVKYYDKNINNKIIGGRTNALNILDNIKKFKNYEDNRNDLNYNTTLLSGYLKFGCISLIETYHAMKHAKLSDLIKQLYWRQYFFILAKFNYNSYNHQDMFFKNIKWKNDIKEARLLWDKAKTGFPAIDASVRQLLQEGYMHNRGRLIVSSFAVKILHQDPFNWPAYGGQFVFSRLLYDNCYANNYGNWNFTLGLYDAGGFRFGRAGTKGGRMINPTNFRKWDPELKYIRKYIPELEQVPDKDVFNWNSSYKKYTHINYPSPMVDYNKRKNGWYVLTKI